MTVRRGADGNLPAQRRQNAGNQVKQGGFPAAVGAADAVRAPRHERPRKTAQNGLLRVVGKGDVFNTNARLRLKRQRMTGRFRFWRFKKRRNPAPGGLRAPEGADGVVHRHRRVADGIDEQDGGKRLAGRDLPLDARQPG